MKKIIAITFSAFLFSGCLDVTPSYVESRGKNPVAPATPSNVTAPPPKNIPLEVKNSLNKYNSRWDNFNGHLEKGKSYYCNNNASHKALRFKVLQVISENEILVTRNSAQECYEEICEYAIFYVLGKTSYADNATLKDGEYICLGTYQYENKNNDLKTVYALIEKEYLEEYAEKVKQEQ